MTMMANGSTAAEDMTTFRLVVIYNFSFSLVGTGPVLMVATRYLADQIFVKKVNGIVGMFFGALVLLCAVTVVTLLLTAFGSAGQARVASTVATERAGLAPTTPLPQVVAQVGDLRIDLPVAQQQLTALGYYGAGNGALALEPLGRQGNRGRLGRLVDRILGRTGDGLVWYRLRGGHGTSTSALAVGAAPGADVFSPVDGTVVGITTSFSGPELEEVGAHRTAPDLTGLPALLTP